MKIGITKYDSSYRSKDKRFPGRLQAHINLKMHPKTFRSHGGPYQLEEVIYKPWWRHYRCTSCGVRSGGKRMGLFGGDGMGEREFI